MKKKPNVLIIHTDQQSTWTLGCYGNDTVKTPYIDSLAEEGAICNDFLTPSALCTPSRGCFVTGRYPYFNGALTNNLPLNEDEVTFAHLLKNQGYDTGYIGKWHLDGAARPGWMGQRSVAGFDDCFYMHNRGHFKRVIERQDGNHDISNLIGDEKTYTTDFMTDRAVQFISEDRENPFLLMLSIPDPHTPFNVRSPYDKMYPEEDMTVPETFYMEKLPDWAESAELVGRRNNYPLDSLQKSEAKLKKVKSQYFGQVKCIDDNVGKLIKMLKEKGIYDDTIVVFTSDHGEYMGEHGMHYKNYFYETAYRVPFIIRWPEKIQAGTVVDEIVTMVDFLPTLMGLLGYDAGDRVQGRNAAPLLQEGAKVNHWENVCFLHPTTEDRAGIFTKQFELAYVHEPFKDHILFDRQNDPEQKVNLFRNPAYQQVVEELTDRIGEHFQSLHVDPVLLPAEIRKRLQ